jgi:signal transduction histidine kinase
MSYPIWVEGNLLGVICAGQILLKGVVQTKQLAEIEEYLVWDRTDLSKKVPEQFCQVDDVVEALREKQERGRITSQERAELENIVRHDPSNRNVDTEGLVSRFQDLLKFGKIMEGLLAQLYELHVNAAEQRLLRDMAVDLVSRTRDPEGWWTVLAKVIEAFRTATDLGTVDVYCREQSVYVQKVGREGPVPAESAKVVPFDVCLDLPADSFKRIDELQNSTKLGRWFGTGDGGYVYKCDLSGPDGQSISTIIAVHHMPELERSRRFAADFCSMVALRTDVTDVLSQIMRDRREFEDRVRRVSHSAKTPLQVALMHLRRAWRRLEQGQAGNVREVTKRLSAARKSILESKQELLELGGRLMRPIVVVDLREIVTSVSTEMEPLTSEKSCCIEVDIPAEEMRVRICVDEMRIALRNLLDNAIKYSFSGQSIGITVEAVQGNTVRIVLRNYGVGIPEEERDAVLRIGGRAEVVDFERPYKDRRGSGWGVPIALDIVERHGGSLNIESWKTGRSRDDSYLRWVTEVTVALPLVMER